MPKLTGWRSLLFSSTGVDKPDVIHWKNQADEAKRTAMWIARATWAANNCDDAPFRDSEANRTRADRHRKAKAIAKEHRRARDGTDHTDSSSDNLRGHQPEKVLQTSGIRSGWRCKICRKMASKKCHLTSRKCKGDPVANWSKLQAEEDEPAIRPISPG